jgi:hypothetical protein
VPVGLQQWRLASLGPWLCGLWDRLWTYAVLKALAAAQTDDLDDDEKGKDGPGILAMADARHDWLAGRRSEWETPVASSSTVVMVGVWLAR